MKHSMTSRANRPRMGQPHMGGAGPLHLPPEAPNVEWDYMKPPVYAGLKSRALVESIYKALGRGVRELELQDLHRMVKNDYGEVTARSIGRWLEAMVKYGDVERLGETTPHRYRRIKK